MDRCTDIMIYLKHPSYWPITKMYTQYSVYYWILKKEEMIRHFIHGWCILYIVYLYICGIVWLCIGVVVCLSIFAFESPYLYLCGICLCWDCRVRMRSCTIPGLFFKHIQHKHNCHSRRISVSLWIQVSYWCHAVHCHMPWSESRLGIRRYRSMSR